MRSSQLTRTAVAGSLILGCWVGIFPPVAAAPPNLGIAAPAPDNAGKPIKPNESPTGVGSAFELTFWQSVAASEDADQLQAYLARYPDGTFSGLARAKIAALAKHSDTAKAAVASNTAPTAAPPPSPSLVKAPAEADDDDLVGPAAAIPGASAAVVRTAVPPAQTSTPAKLASEPPKVVKLTPVPPEPVTAAQATVAALPKTNSAETPVSPSLAQQLRALGQSQGHRSEVVAVARSEPAVQRPYEPPMPRQLIAIPSRPKLSTVPNIDLPDHFCTAMERHNFYNSVYQPARSIADQNDRIATGHLLKLQSVYDDYAQRQDQAATDAIGIEVRDYEALASDAHHASVAFEGLLDSLMAVPLRQCGEPA